MYNSKVTLIALRLDLERKIYNVEQIFQIIYFQYLELEISEANIQQYFFIKHYISTYKIMICSRSFKYYL